jgi:anti-sigma B factor antagonist/stage II sporulation protein AA (anti-sigma F factor antagonist)
MRFSQRRYADAVVAAPAGHIDHPTAQQLEQTLAPLIAEAGAARAPVVLDFADVDYISSMGLRVLMIVARQMRAHGARIAVASLQPVVAEIFEIARFAHVVEVFPTVRDALQALSPPAAATYAASPS